MSTTQIMLSILLIFVLIGSINIKIERYDSPARPIKSISWKVDFLGIALAVLILVALKFR